MMLIKYKHHKWLIIYLLYIYSMRASRAVMIHRHSLHVSEYNFYMTWYGVLCLCHSWSFSYCF